MSALLGLNGAAAAKPIVYSGLNVSTSKMDTPIPIFWGMRRLTTNAIWYNDFQKHSQSKGGKGGGKGGQYDYTAATITALCEGPIDLIQNIWSATSTTSTTTLSRLNKTLFTGTAVQAPWSFVVSKYPAQARAYAYTAYLGDPKEDLGNTASVPDNQYECQRLLSFPYSHTTSAGYIDPTTRAQSPGVDVLLSDCIDDWLTSSQYGMGFSSGDLGSLTQYATYNRAQGLFFSPVLDSQETATSVLDRWSQISNAWIFWSGTQLLFYPLADAAITGNGVTFTPDNDVAYNLTLDDFEAEEGAPPVKVNRLDPADAYNRTRINITDRILGYASNPLEYKNQTLLDQYGLRDNPAVDGKDICDRAVGLIVTQLVGKRAAYIRKTYAFKTNYRFIRCLPGTVLTLTEPNIGLNLERVRVRTINEDDNELLNFVCEEFPGSVATYGAMDPGQSNVPTTPSTNVDPGNVNTPCIIEPDSAFTGGVAKLLISASGGANWGGAQIWLSFDGGANFTMVGEITATAAQGVLTAPLASHADPDTVNTLSVDLTQSLTTLPVLSHGDADDLRSLSCVASQPALAGGVYVMPTNYELVAPGTNTSTGTYTSDLTYLRRGQYGTAPGAHSSGDQFSVVDVAGTTGTTFAYDLPAQYIGQTIHIKLLSKNPFKGPAQDISTVNEYSYTPTGAGYGSGTGGVPASPTGLAAGNPSPQLVALGWNANAATDNVSSYLVYRATGLSQPFSSASLIGPAVAPAYNDTTAAPGGQYTYFIKAQNAVGISAASAGVNMTVSTASLTLVGLAFTKQDISAAPLNTVIPGGAWVVASKILSTAHGGFVEGFVDNAPSADTDFQLLKDGSSFATVRWASGSNTPTLINAADVSNALGDYTDIKTPANLNGMSGGFRLTIAAVKT